MAEESFIDKALSRAPTKSVVIFALLFLVGIYGAAWTLQPVLRDGKTQEALLYHVLEKTQISGEPIISRGALKTLDLEQLKSSLSGHAQSQKSLYESGLSLQEERRLLEKQLEILNTTLLINPALQRVFLMRDEQPMQSYLLKYIPIKAYAGASTTLPTLVRIVSKERFAHPERGKAEQVEGTLQWTPPQVGTSVRSNALGEYVIFTNSALILHGPPVRDEDHARFAHVCLGLDRDAAQRLYRSSFIGTKIALRGVAIEAAAAP